MLCKRPTNSLFINSNGGLRPDPRYDQDIDFIDNYNTLSEYLNSDLLKSVQKNLSTDENCLDCINITRQSSFNPVDSTNTELSTLFLGLSNQCNFECRMCGSYASDQLINRDKELQKTPFRQQYAPFDKPRRLRQNQFDKLFQDLDVFSSLKTIKINGGEPFVEEINFQILERLSPLAGEINIAIITNGSIFPNKEKLAVLSKFKSVKINFGLEAIGKIYEYVRRNSNWETTKANVDKFSDLFDVKFHVSLTAMTIYDMEPLLDFIGGRYVEFQTITRPEYLSHNIFGNSLTEIYPNRLHNMIPDYDMDQAKLATFLSYVSYLDQYYGTSLTDIQPKFKSLL